MRISNNVFILFLFLFSTITLGAENKWIVGMQAFQLGTLASKMNHPSALTNYQNNYFVLDGANERVLVFTKNGKIIKQFPETKSRVVSSEASLSSPMDIQFYQGHFYIADTGHQRIAMFNSKGKYQRSIDLSTISTSYLRDIKSKKSEKNDNKRESQSPEPVAVLIHKDRLYYSDRANHRVCRITLPQANQQQCWGENGSAEGDFRFPFILALDQGNYLHVVDVLNSRIQIFNHKGQYYGNVGRFGTREGELVRPNGLAFDSRGLLYVSDYYQGKVSIYKQRRFIAYLTDKVGRILRFHSPVGLIIEGDELSIVEAGSNKVSRFQLRALFSENKQEINDTKLVNKIRPAKKQNCATCHLSWENEEDIHAGSIALQSHNQEKVLPVVKPEMCLSCHHGAVVDSRDAITEHGQHPDIHHLPKENQLNKNEDDISEKFPLVEKNELYCGSCHTPHEDHQLLYKSESNPWMREPNQQGQICMQCHESKSFDVQKEKDSEAGKNHPVGYILHKPGGKKHPHFSQNKDLWNGFPNLLRKKGGLMRLNINKQEEMICQSCHRVHGAEGEKLVLVNNKNGQLCKSCHARHWADSLEEAKASGVHPVNIVLKEPLKVHGQSVKRIECLTCHSVHEGETGTANLVLNDKNGALCEGCHEGKRALINHDHDLRVTAAENENQIGHHPEQSGACGACHSMHRGSAKKPFLFIAEDKGEPLAGDDIEFGQQLNNLTVRDKLCLNCHQSGAMAEDKAVRLFDHPFREIVMISRDPRFPLVDSQGQLAEQGQIACVTCHNPHQWRADSPVNVENKPLKSKKREGNVLNSFLNTTTPDELFCKDCHGNETRLRYKYYHDELSRMFDSAIQ